MGDTNPLKNTAFTYGRKLNSEVIYMAGFDLADAKLQYIQTSASPGGG